MTGWRMYGNSANNRSLEKDVKETDMGKIILIIGKGFDLDIGI